MPVAQLLYDVRYFDVMIQPLSLIRTLMKTNLIFESFETQSPSTPDLQYSLFGVIFKKITTFFNL